MFGRWFLSGVLLLLPCAVQASDRSPGGGTGDPWQGLNRKTQAFNDAADRWVLKPVAKGYAWIMPNLLRRGIGNFFSNIRYPVVIVNQFLQGKFAEGASDTGRFIMNTTLGIGGLFDPASDAGMPLHDEDFGQTFGRWGIHSGPYLVLPFLGPSDVRDGIGSIGNFAAQPAYLITDSRVSWGLTVLYFVQSRADLLDAEQLISGDRYIFMRDAYLQRREYLIKDGQVTDDFLDDDWND